MGGTEMLSNKERPNQLHTVNREACKMPDISRLPFLNRRCSGMEDHCGGDSSGNCRLHLAVFTGESKPNLVNTNNGRI